MRGPSPVLLAFLASALVSTSPAWARMIPRAERGAVALVADVGPEGLSQPVLVAKGQVAWTERFHPQYTVQLVDDVPRRIRPGAPALAAGTILYGFNLPSGLAFCPPINFRSGVPDVQCLRDIDGDGTFDGGYVTDWPTGHSRILPELLMELVPVHKVRYRVVEPDAAMMVPGAMVFDGFRRGKAVFKVRIEDETLPNDEACEPLPDGECRVLNVTLKVTAQGQQAAIALVRASSVRGLSIITTEGPDIPGFPKPRSGQGQ
jgi:hypothetical protein